MEYFKVYIELENAAFEDEPATELARILRNLASKIEKTGDLDHKLKDINGNTVGNSEHFG